MRVCFFKPATVDVKLIDWLIYILIVKGTFRNSLHGNKDAPDWQVFNLQ